MKHLIEAVASQPEFEKNNCSLEDTLKILLEMGVLDVVTVAEHEALAMYPDLLQKHTKTEAIALIAAEVGLPERKIWDLVGRNRYKFRRITGR